MKTADGSIKDSDGKIIFFSFDRFMSDIVRGNCCFICGVGPKDATFNDEHVLPDWLLRKYRLHDKSVTLPNGTQFRYGGFTVPCCARCNALMGEQFENPIRELFAKGSDEVNRELKENGPWRLFCWMCLIFVKTHLKDQSLNLHLDRRKGNEKIGELHDWGQLHHIHCMARSFYTGCELNAETMGSLLVVPAKVRSHYESFDYVDLSFARTMLLRIDEIAVIAVLDDSQGALNIFSEKLNMIGGPLSPLQAREIAAHFASINLQLAERTVFASEFDILTDKCTIVARRPHQLMLSDWNSEILGGIMHRICDEMLVVFPNKDEISEQIKTGRRTFLVDDNGNFVTNSMELEENGSHQGA
ncbi:MAG: hypothetical protein LAO09_01320 [Acidobacteriia bacterium]|nr:hypothetical protein [Terriglobia bacterium]